jgi:hypothetical protein
VSDVRVLLDDDVLRLATWRSVVVARWYAPPNAAYMRDMREKLRPFVAERGAFGAINVVDIRDVGTLPEDARHEVALTQRSFEGTQRALATVIRGTGFWSATVRSLASGLAILSRVKFPQRVFDDVAPASAWVASLVPDVGAGRAVALRAAVDSLARKV